MLYSLVSDSGGSRISRWGDADLRRVCFSVKTFGKTKELDPIGEGTRRWRPLDLPMSQHNHCIGMAPCSVEGNGNAILSQNHINIGLNILLDI